MAEISSSEPDTRGTNRIILDHEFRSILPFPVATAFYHYRSGSSAGALRAQRLFIALESTLRYAALVAISDYATSPEPDGAVLSRLRGLLFAPGSRGLAMGTWLQALETVLRETGRSWQDMFVPGFAEVEPGWLNDQTRPVVEQRNRLAHGQRLTQLGLKGSAAALESNLYTVLQALQFLARCNLCYVPWEYEEDTPAPGRPVGIHLCRGSSADFYEVMVRPSKPIPAGTPFIWNQACSALLILEPFLILGRTELRDPRSGVTLAIEGLQVYDGAGHYRALDQEARISVRSIQHPRPETLNARLEQVLTPEATRPFRSDTALQEEDTLKLRTRPGDLPAGAELEGARDTYAVVGQPIGHGGMSTIYLARRGSDNAVCALKVLPLLMHTQPGFVRRFLRESRLAQSLDDQHLVRVLDAGYSHSQHFMVMEYVSGGSLADELWRRSGHTPPCSLAETLALMREILAGVRAIHHAGLVHRDLKPSNIMLTFPAESEPFAEPFPKITDFGLVRRVGDQSAVLTATLDQLGTFEYMAPEQFHGKDSEIDERADIYALGKVLCLLLSGRIPKNVGEVETLDFGSLLAAEEGGGPREGIKRVVQRCIAEQPEDRFQTVEELADALGRLEQLDNASVFLDGAGIAIPEVRIAFAMAQIGHADAERRLRAWAGDTSDAGRHYEAALALSGVPHGIETLIERVNELSEQEPSRTDSLLAALGHIVAFREATFPKLRGEQWLHSLRGRPRRRLFLELLTQAFRRRRKGLWEAVVSYGALSGITGGLVGLVCSLCEASMFWRIVLPGTPYWTRVMTGLGPSVVACSIWGGLGAMIGWVGAKLPRPLRFGAIALGGLLGGLTLGLLLWVFARTVFPALPEIVAQAPAAAELLALFPRFFGGLGLLAALGTACAFTLKHLPAVQRHRPCPWISTSFFAGCTLLCVLPWTRAFVDPFRLREAYSIAVIAAGSGVGAGLADWLLDRKYPPRVPERADEK